MKQRMILYGLTLMLGCFVLASCVNEDEGPCLSSNGSKAQVLFSLVLPDNAQTREEGDPETWGNYDPKESGVGYDNQINPAGVQMLLFKGNEYAGKLKDLTYTIPSENVYNYIGTAPDDLVSGDYKFVILANAPTITPASFDDENFANLAFTYLGGTSLPNIPMWGTKGVTEETTLTVKAGTRHDIGKISLLRAVSKVTVKIDERITALSGYSLKEVTVDKYNNNGYVLPSAYATVTETTELEIEDESLHANESSQGTKKKYSAAEGAKELTFYLPEYNNASKDATLSVVLNLTEEEENEEGEPIVTVEELTFPSSIEFKDYVGDGHYFDIVRNHHYIFTIKEVKGNKLSLTVQTVPWEDESVTVNYTETVMWNDGGAPDWTTPGTIGEETIDEIKYNVLYVNGGDDLSCAFTLNAPEGWLWYAELEPLTEGASNYIKFADGTTLASGSVGQASTLYLKIATGDTTTQHRSRLRMYVRTPSGDKSLEVKNLHYIISRSI